MKICGLMKVTLLDYPGHVACTAFTGGCNFRCPFCYNSELIDMNAPAVMEIDELYKFLESRVGRLEGVAFTGGEPTLHPELPDVMRHIKGYFGMEIKLDTNGTNPDMLYEILCEGIAEYVAMDIKASPDNYGKAAGIDISREMMAKITSSKDMLIKGGPVVHEFRTTVVGGLHGDEDFEGIRDYIKGAANYFLQRYTENDNVLCKDRGFYPQSKEDLERYLEIVKPAVGHAAIRGVD